MVKRLFYTLFLSVACFAATSAQQTEQTVSITTLATMTDGEAYYTTFSCNQPLDFTTLSDKVRAYVVVKTETKRCETIINLEQCEYSLDAISCKAVQKAPANTGLLIKTIRPGTYPIPVAKGSVPDVVSSLVPVGNTDVDACNVISEFVDDIRFYYVPYVLGRKSGRLGFFRERPTQNGWDPDTTQPIFAEGEITLKRNTAYLPLDYWQDTRDGSEMEGNGVNQGGLVSFQAEGSFDDVPQYVNVEITVPVGATDGTGYYRTYFNKNQDLDFSQVDGLKAYIVTVDSTKYRPKAEFDTMRVVGRIDLKEIQRVPAATPIVLKANRSNTFDVPTLDENTRLDDVTGNALMSVATKTDVASMLNAIVPVFPYQLTSSTGYAGFGPFLPDDIGEGRYASGQIELEEGSVYLPISGQGHEYVQLSEEKYLRFGIECVPYVEEPKPEVPKFDITITGHAAGDSGYYATHYTGEHKLDFTQTEGVTAYVVTGEQTDYYPNAADGDSSVVYRVLGRIDLKQIGVVEPFTPIIVYSQKAGTYSVPQAEENAPRYDASGNILLYTEIDVDVDNTAGNFYTLQFNHEQAGFSPCVPVYDESAMKNIMPKGSCYLELGEQDHAFITASNQHYLPFGVTLTLPEIEKPDTIDPDTIKPDTIPVVPKTKIDVSGMVADATGNYTAFYSTEKTLDFTDVTDIKAYIVRTREEEYEGATVITEIDLSPVLRVPVATPIIVTSTMPGEYAVPEVPADAAFDDTSGNALLIKGYVQPAARDYEPEKARYFYTLTSYDSKVGFLPVSGFQNLPDGFIYIELSEEAHRYVQGSYQQALFFGEQLEVNGIADITADTADTRAVYRLSGQRAHSLGRGINILQLSNGRTRKVLLK